MQIVLIFTIGFTLASFLGYVAQRLKLPYILGYLLAGFIIGPFSPGFVANLAVSEQLAEIGVVLMLFGVGLHFKLQDLYNVKHVAIPGAIVQTVVAATVGAGLIYYLGWPIKTGVIIGLAIGVASTVVLVRVLSDFHLLGTMEGHIAVGWLIVEDILTISVLILLPMIANFFHGGRVDLDDAGLSIVLLIAKLGLLALFMFTLGHRVVEWILVNVARVRSHELFTLSVVALIFVIAVGSAYIFGTSIALGAFIAGMVIGQTEVRHQALANSLPLKDVFAVIFFLSIGMLFNPMVIVDHFPLFIGVLGIILIIKPLSALLIVLGYNFSLKVALTVAIALSQIGEFSFILAQQATQLNLLPDEGFDVLIACALISISINPLLFRFIRLFEKRTSKINIAKILNSGDLRESTERISQLFEMQVAFSPKVVLVGFSALGEAISLSLEKRGIKPAIIERNIDAIPTIREGDRYVIFGDAAQGKILESAKTVTASLLVITINDLDVALNIIRSARQINPKLSIIARLGSKRDATILEEMNVDFVSCDAEEKRAFIRKVQANTVRY